MSVEREGYSPGVFRMTHIINVSQELTGVHLALVAMSHAHVTRMETGQVIVPESLTKSLQSEVKTTVTQPFEQIPSRHLVPGCN